MATRIRYEKTDKDGILHSVRNFFSSKYLKHDNGEEEKESMYYVILDTNQMTYAIKNMTSGRKYKGGDGINNLHVLKRNVKTRLEGLGVKFNDEIRDNASRVKGVNCGYKTVEE